jgi:hypothetical protein
MKKPLLLLSTILVLASSCSLFRKKETYGCQTDGRNVGAERIAAGDEKAIKAASKAKYKGGRKAY